MKEDKILIKYVRKNKPSEKILIKKFGKKRVREAYIRGDVYNSNLSGNINAIVKPLSD